MLQGALLTPCPVRIVERLHQLTTWAKHDPVTCRDAAAITLIKASGAIVWGASDNLQVGAAGVYAG